MITLPRKRLQSELKRILAAIYFWLTLIATEKKKNLATRILNKEQYLPARTSNNYLHSVHTIEDASRLLLYSL